MAGPDAVSKLVIDLETLPERLADLAAGFALVVAALLLLTFLWRSRRRSLAIEDFTGPNPEIAKGLSALVRTELHRLREEGAGVGLRFVEGPDKPISIPDEIKSLPGPLGGLAALAVLVPQRVQTLAGRVHPPGERGVGLTVSLLSGSRETRGSITVWEEEFGSGNEAEASYRLAIAGAAWVAYQLVKPGYRREHRALLTWDWQSYALFRVGAVCHEAGDTAAARSAYAKALDIDPLNRGALFNLATLDFADRCHAPAIARFDLVRAETERAGGATGHAYDRLWYRSTFNVAAAYLHERATQMYEPGLERPAACTLAVDLGPALEAALDLVRTTTRTISRLEARRHRMSHAERSLLGFLRVVESAGGVVLRELLEPA